MEARAIDLSTVKFSDGPGGGTLVEWQEEGRPKQAEIHSAVGRILLSLVDSLRRIEAKVAE